MTGGDTEEYTTVGDLHGSVLELSQNYSASHCSRFTVNKTEYWISGLILYFGDSLRSNLVSCNMLKAEFNFNLKAIM